MFHDFERDHATSPCLSTAIGNRQLPSDERWAVRLWFGSGFRASRVPRARWRAVEVLYQTATNASKRATGERAQHRENRSDNFFTFVTQWTHGSIPDSGLRA
jgi:hypothetical protein